VCGTATVEASRSSSGSCRRGGRRRQHTYLQHVWGRFDTLTHTCGKSQTVAAWRDSRVAFLLLLPAN
jgi:hypothetical protein